MISNNVKTYLGQASKQLKMLLPKHAVSLTTITARIGTGPEPEMSVPQLPHVGLLLPSSLSKK
jgi:hypothetical protein